MQLSEDRRSEIASFLRQRRARLRPGDVGLPAGRRRRTPGLRREEVAALAGVSTEWYKWLEQARAVSPSMETLRRISDALRCEPGETRHLLTLAGYGEPHATPPSNGDVHVVGDHIMRLIAQLDPCPAWVHGERWDFLAWNRAATIIHGDLAALHGIERNGLYQFFLGDRMRRTLVDWERHARGLVGTLRHMRARYVDDAWFDLLLEALQGSADFAELWADHHVRPFQDGRKEYEHPDAGRLSFEYTVLRVADERLPVMHLVTYIPVTGTDTRVRLEELLGAVRHDLRHTAVHASNDDQVREAAFRDRS